MPRLGSLDESPTRSSHSLKLVAIIADVAEGKRPGSSGSKAPLESSASRGSLAIPNED